MGIPNFLTCVRNWAPLSAILAILFVLFANGSSPQSKPTAKPLGIERIVFFPRAPLDANNAGEATAAGNIWIVNEDGTGLSPLTRMTTHNADCISPAWSPRGTEIAFASGRALDGTDAASAEDTKTIWVMKPDGSQVRPLIKLDNASEPAWSPDGARIAFDGWAALDGSPVSNPASNIWTMSSNGSRGKPLTKLTAEFANSYLPIWSPDGNQIAFVSSRALDGSDAANLAPGHSTHNVITLSGGATSNIWIVNSDGAGARPLTRLTAYGADSFGMRWSPDGKKIAFASRRALDGSDTANTKDSANIWVVNSDGSGARPLTKLQFASSLNLAWSRDGSKIVFVSDRALDGSDASNRQKSAQNIWVMNSDGSGAMPLTQLILAVGMTQNPVWSPTGTRIAFSSMRALDGSDDAGTNRNIWVINADGTGAKPLTRFTGAGAFSVAPAWSPR